MKKSNNSLSRRNFIGTVGTATAAFTIVPRNVIAGMGYQQPSDIVNIASIGLGSQGTSDIQNLCTPDEPIVTPERHRRTGILPSDPLYKVAMEGDQRTNYFSTLSRGSVNPAGPAAGGGADPSGPAAGGFTRREREPVKLANIYALCDVDTEFAGPTIKGYPKAKLYTDWRELLEKESSNIDAVNIATPDHNHAIIAAHFIREKKHIYVQKPMAKTIYEIRKLTELAREYDVVTQMGNQFHADEYTRQTVELIQSGAIGFVREVWVTGGSPPWPRGNIQRPDPKPVPSNLNYDVWTGPAPMKPYNPLTLHNQWRALWDYGTGYLGDWIAHYLDPVWWALNLDRPIRVQSTCTAFSSEYYPEAEEITYEFAARGYNPPVKIIWRDGGIKTPRPFEMEQGRNMPVTVYVGDKGYLCGARGIAPTYIPDKPVELPEPWIPRTGNIYEEWIGAIKNGTKTTNDFSYSSKIVESMLLGNIAHKMQNANIILEYDGEDGKFTNSEEANALLHYEYRQGWTL